MKVFGNTIAEGAVKKAQRKAKGYIKRFGDDSQRDYPLATMPHAQLGQHIGLWDVAIGAGQGEAFDLERGVVIGNIRMGFGHYRIAIAMASAANDLGYKPYWLDLHAYQETTGGKLIAHLNGLYAMGSRWSQQYPLFNRFFWEPLNSEGFKKLSYHVEDWFATQLMTPIFKHMPKSLPFVGTHVWPAQAAVHAGMKQVVNAIPDNWPMALHLAPGSLHTVQTPSSYWGYRQLKGMDGDKVLKPIPAAEIADTGHYIDAELLENLTDDNQRRRLRISSGAPLRILMTVGGAGAQFPLFKTLIEALMPLVQRKEVMLLLNVGDHLGVWEKLVAAIPGLKDMTEVHMDDWAATQQWIHSIESHSAGLHVFYHSDVYAAVYATNLLMPHTDLMLTKPSELAFYPVPKVMLPRVGGHEAWGAIRTAELGDGTPECTSPEAAVQQILLLLEDKKQLETMVDAIDQQNSLGTYDGAYKVIQLAMGLPPVGRPRKG